MMSSLKFFMSCSAPSERFSFLFLYFLVFVEGRKIGNDLITQNSTISKVIEKWNIQDDDIRVPFGKAHDHAREIVEKYDALKVLTKALTKFAQVKEGVL